MNGIRALELIKEDVISSGKQTKLIIGNRIPKHFFITSGVGESDITIHAGSYHLALKDAGIERCNIITYTSIMPSIATRIEKPELIHGSVMESIMAISNSENGQRATAGLAIGWLYDKNTGSKFGGLVCEYSGSKPEKEVNSQLNMSLNEIYENGFSEGYEMKEVDIITRSFVPEKRFGTVIVAVCFTDYEYPLVGIE